MFKLQGCPRCHGDLYAGEDIHGAYLACIQCGRYFAAADAPVRAGPPQQAGPVAARPPPAWAKLDLAA